MKKIININLASRLIPMEDSAYDLLKNYLDSLKRYFSREEGGEEIISDIENRIAELFQEQLKKGAHCITDQDVTQVIATMGKPEQLEEETARQAPAEEPAAAQSQPYTAPSNRRLTRDENDKVLGGVCAGMAAYMNVDPVVVRIVFALISFAWGAGFLVYILLWILLPSSKNLHNSVRKRLYRNPEHRVVGGVCSGIAAYLNIDPVVPRLIFVAPLLGIIFSSIIGGIMTNMMLFHHVFFPLSVGAFPTLILVYVVLWISVPKAITVTEKLEMRGEKIDLQSISNAYKSGDEKKNEPVSPEPSPREMPPGPRPVEFQPAPTPKSHTGLGRVLVVLLKAFAVFWLVILLIILCGLLIGISGGFIGSWAFSSFVFPLRGLILHSDMQNFLAWPAVFLTLGIPVVAIIWSLIKIFTGFRPRNRVVGISLLLLWIVGIISAIALAVSVAGDFKTSFREDSRFAMQQPQSGILVLQRAEQNTYFDGTNLFDDELKVADDSVLINNIGLRIEKSPTDSFEIDILRASNGGSLSDARDFVDNLSYSLQQADSVVYLPHWFAINQRFPFRNQRVLIKVYVPLGKQIRVDESADFLRHYMGGWDHEWDYGYDWSTGHTYQMTEDGLKDLQPSQDEDMPDQGLPVPPSAPSKPHQKVDSVSHSYRYKPTRTASIRWDMGAPELRPASLPMSVSSSSGDVFTYLVSNIFSLIAS